MTLDHKFKAACDQVKNFKKKPADTDLLELYSLYKQATIGNVNIPKPTDAKGVAKWEAWSSKKGVDTKTAKESYIAKAEELAATYA